MASRRATDLGLVLLPLLAGLATAAVVLWDVTPSWAQQRRRTPRRPAARRPTPPPIDPNTLRDPNEFDPGRLDPNSTLTLGEAHRGLMFIKTTRLRERHIALRTGLGFVLALGRNDAKAAAGMVDVVGYQALPLTGPLANPPKPPVSPTDFQAYLGKHQFAAASDVRLSAVELRTAAEIATTFGAVSRWMTDQDLALVLPSAAEGGPAWLAQRGCIVLRVRGPRAVVRGGNLFNALKPPTGP
jgi:hypothetical protein